MLERSPELLAGNPEMFDHPVLVWKVITTSPEDAVVKFMFMRSFKNYREKELSSLSPRFLRIAHHSKDPGARGSLVAKSAEEKFASQYRASPDVMAVWNLEAAFRDLGLGWHPPSMVVKGMQYREKLPPSNGDLLHLERTSSRRSMTKNSFIDTGKIYSIEWQELRCYAISQKPDGYRHRLNHASFNKVIENTMQTNPTLSTPEWIDSDNLWETFIRKHIHNVITYDKKPTSVL